MYSQSDHVIIPMKEQQQDALSAIAIIFYTVKIRPLGKEKVSTFKNNGNSPFFTGIS
ncbi:hypothetical protein [Bartonella sp. AP58NXGY]|uniref:hypothetical protein n=1 Tax=Bartonella sp. AP58NXGY TaxID=3243498 RepID=UPI0035CED38A